jgi:hypothetical protein
MTILRVTKKQPIDAVEFFLKMLGKPRITAEQVRQMFIEAIGTKRLPVPAAADCEPIAKILNEFFSLGPVPNVRPARHSKAREQLLNAKKHLMLEREGEPNKAQKYWRLARDKLAEEKQAFAQQISRHHLTNYYAALWGAIEAIEQIDDPFLNRADSINAANVLIDLWDVYPPPKWNWHSRAKWISDLAQEAWRKAGKVPRDRGMREDHPPLCEFVALALAAIWQRHTISNALRERRGIAKRR